ncbi:MULTISPECIES: aldo/keto reductase [Oceanobacillus]|uniref:Oxidoreductase YqkF n=1 Tax=Oceanobacillus kimchii TaxID=746691 RepID=A0ABQ5TI02_9BACI|nr:MULTISPECIES: aldo/keto reductase [Oceanobacillus]MBT2598398.1 aldo/keto reductase [Oceanobacillus sp. ISL-74]MBT2651316.1 aldo/keto reductase [Oceanobacillus sp. ISL-73]GLO66504.1 putative oxidoreductase YqkF [Oceanobacillus kimchii]
MRYNLLGKSNISISELTLGCMSLGSDYQHANKIIDAAVENGINHLDTADLYDFGINEQIVGKSIKHQRDQVVITSKVGNHFQESSKDWFWDPSKEYIHHAVRDSLKRLQIDYLDVCMLHGGTIDDPIDETIEAFEELKTAGLIRTYGISSIRPNVIREYANRSSIDVLMTQYSLLDRRPEEEILPLALENNISVVCRGPLAKGMISNKMKDVIDKKGENGYLNYSYTELKNLNDRLHEIRSDYSIQELAMHYVGDHPAITSTVFGASSLDQLEENIHEYNKTDRIDDTIYHRLQEITKAQTYEKHR